MGSIYKYRTITKDCVVFLRIFQTQSYSHSWYLYTIAERFLKLKTDTERLYKENSHVLMAVAMRYVHDKEVAEDIVHDSWIIIFTNLESLKAEDKLLPWMKGITRNLSLKYLDAQKRHPYASITENQEDVIVDETEPMLPLVPFNELMSMIDTLPEKYGEVFRLSVLSGMSHQEIGDLLGIAPHSSSSDLSRAKKLLVQKVRKYLLMTLTLLLPVSILVIHHRNSRPVTTDGPMLAEQEQMQDIHIEEETEVKILVPEEVVRHVYRNNEPEERTTTPQKAILPQIEKLEAIRSAATTVPAPVKIAYQHRSVSSAPQSSDRENEWNTSLVSLRRLSRKTLAGGWTALLGLSGVSGLSSTTLSNTITLANYSPIYNTPGNLVFSNWREYSDYAVNSNAFLNTSEREAFLNALDNKMEGMDDGLEETQLHFRPLAIYLSAEKHIDDRWAIESGIGFTYLKSQFKNSYLGNLGGRKQQLYYISVPLGVKYTVLSHKRLSLYLSCGGELDIPVHGRQLVVGADPRNIRGSFMGAIETSAGIQYGLFPHINAYVELGARYNITGSSSFDTYYSTHPLMLSTPLGLRWQF